MKKRFDWETSKQKILAILSSEAPEETRKKQMEAFLRTLPFGIALANYEFRYDACGYPYYAVHSKIKGDSFKLREILDMRFDSESFETDYLCPICKKPV